MGRVFFKKHYKGEVVLFISLINSIPFLNSAGIWIRIRNYSKLNTEIVPLKIKLLCFQGFLNFYFMTLLLFIFPVPLPIFSGLSTKTAQASDAARLYSSW